MMSNEELTLKKLKSLDSELENIDSESIDVRVPEGSEEATEIKAAKKDISLDDFSKPAP